MKRKGQKGIIDPDEEIEDPEAVELLGLDVRYVSGVSEPATGKQFLLYKSKQGDGMADKPKAKHYPWDKCVADQKAAGADDPAAVCASIARRSSLPNKVKAAKSLLPLTDFYNLDFDVPEDMNMDDLITAAQADLKSAEPQNHASGLLAELGKNLARAFGVMPADDALLKAIALLQQVAEKQAGGTIVTDDTGHGKPQYKGNRPYAAHSMVDDDDAAKPGMTAPGTSQKQMADVVAGTPGTGDTPGSDTVLGQPVTKSAFMGMLSKLESQASNPAALEQARVALEEAFAPPGGTEDHMKEQEVRDLLLKTLDPIIEAVEEVQAAVEAVDQNALTEQMAALTQQIANVNVRLDALSGQVTNEPAQRPTAKSRIPPVHTQPAAKGDALWAGSPFDIAAQV